MSGTIGTSSYGPLDLVLAGANSLRQQYANLQEQTTSGLISQSYSGLAPSAVSQFMDLTAVSNQNNAYTNSITMAQGQASVMQNALTQVSSLISSVSSSALSDSGTVAAGDLTSTQQQATQALSQLVSLMNTTYSGDYVFAGENTSVAPATQTSSTAASFTGATAADVQIGPSESVSLGLSSGGIAAINNVMTQLSAIATSTSANFSSTMATAATVLSASGTTLSDESAAIGQSQDTMTAASNLYSTMQTALTTQISDLTQVDMATAVSKMQAVNTQLQSSYQVLADMDKLNLASYL